MVNELWKSVNICQSSGQGQSDVFVWLLGWWSVCVCCYVTDSDSGSGSDSGSDSDSGLCQCHSCWSVCVCVSSLACAVSYVTASGDKMYFRKFFKFHVSLSLSIIGHEYCFMPVINMPTWSILTEHITYTITCKLV